jgi:hypothetical protein
MGWGWYTNDKTKIGECVSLLFEVLERDHAYGGNQDDFAIALEDAEDATLATGDWEFGEIQEDGLIQLVKTEHEVSQVR